MTLTRKIELGAIALTTLTLGAAYLWWGQMIGMLFIILAGLGWLFAALRSKPAYASYSFALAMLLSFFAANSWASPILILVSVSSALAAWDLSRFSARLEKIQPPEAANRLEKLHLNRLGLSLGIGIAIGLAAILIRFQLGFIFAFILGLLAFIAISYLVRTVSAEPKPE